MNKYNIAFISISRKNLSGASYMLSKLLNEFDKESFNIFNISQFENEFSLSLVRSSLTNIYIPLNTQKINIKTTNFILKKLRLFQRILHLLKNSKAYLKVIKKNQIDIVWCENFSTLLLLGLRKNNFKIIYNMWSDVRSKIALRFIEKKSDFIILESKNQISKFSKKTNLKVIYTQISSELINSIVDNKKTISGLIGFMGGYKYSKGIDDFLSMIEYLEENISCNFSYLIAAANPDDYNLLKSKHRNILTKYNNKIQVFGWIPRVEFFSKIEIFLSLSKSEGLSGSIREALLSRLKVFATDVGGTSDILEDPEFIINSRFKNLIHIEAAKKIMSYYDNKEFYNEKFKSARVEAEKKFMDNNWVSSVENIAIDLLKEFD